jgi:hypothetical protein
MSDPKPAKRGPVAIPAGEPHEVATARTKAALECPSQCVRRRVPAGDIIDTGSGRFRDISCKPVRQGRHRSPR